MPIQPSRFNNNTGTGPPLDSLDVRELQLAAAVAVARAADALAEAALNITQRRTPHVEA